MEKYVLSIVAVIVTAVSLPAIAAGDQGFAAQENASRQYRAQAPSQEMRQNATRNNVQEPVFDGNKHLLRYIPGNLKMYRVGTICPTDASYSQNPGSGCSDLRGSDGKVYRIQTSNNNGNAEAVYVVSSNGRTEPWVKFRQGTQQVVFESPGAQQYAMNNGGSSQQITQGKQPAPVASGNTCAGLPGDAKKVCELLKDNAAIGAIFGR